MGKLEAKEAEVRFRSRIPPPDPTQAEAIARRQSLWWASLRDYVSRGGRPEEPFVEVACGGRPRSAFLTAEHGLRGYAVDIALQSLLNAKRRMEILGIARQPTLICADADTLPFADHGVRFLITFEFLHHLSDPAPFLREVRRVLGGGRYFFDEEPFAPRFRLHLYKRRRECSSLEESERHPLVRFVRYYTSDPLCQAAEEGVVERMDLRIGNWRAILSELPGARLRGTAVGGFWSADPWATCTFASTFLDLLGGSLSGEWVAPGGDSPEATAAMACPTCHGPLKAHGKEMECGGCGEVYPEFDGIPVLIPPALRRRLYPSLG